MYQRDECRAGKIKRLLFECDYSCTDADVDENAETETWAFD